MPSIENILMIGFALILLGGAYTFANSAMTDIKSNTTLAFEAQQELLKRAQ